MDMKNTKVMFNTHEAKQTITGTRNIGRDVKGDTKRKVAERSGRNGRRMGQAGMVKRRGREGIVNKGEQTGILRKGDRKRR